MSALLKKLPRHAKDTENLVGPGVGGGPTLGTHTIHESLQLTNALRLFFPPVEYKCFI